MPWTADTLHRMARVQILPPPPDTICLLQSIAALRIGVQAVASSVLGGHGVLPSRSLDLPFVDALSSVIEDSFPDGFDGSRV